MANENKEIGDIVKKCKILLLDIEGTTTSISFVKDKLFPYAEENVKQFLESQWETDDVKEVVAALRKLALEDQAGSVDGAVAIPGEDASKEDQIEGVVSSVKWQMSADRKAGPLKQLQGLIWKQGYDKGDIKGHVYDDVSAALDAWQAVDGQKVYIYSSGSVQAQKLLFGQSLSGDLLKYIEGHFDTAVGAKQEAASYKNIVEKIGCNPEDVLFLTDILKEAEAAREAGVKAALVSREGNAPLPAEASSFPVLHSLAELTVSNKRKPEPQETETPAKILKTDVEDNVKASSEAAPPAAAETAVEKETETEKMEVEDNGTSNDGSNDVPMNEQVTVEELDSNEATSIASVCHLEPVVEEKEEKTEEKGTETKKSSLTNGKGVDVPVPEETPPATETTITEIEEIVDLEKPLSDAAEVIENIEPVVEEPDADMEVLQNVGEVLEKECDEILSKVNNVTNIDNIPSNASKPHLNTIAEETMETENTDTNDIVEGILDSELENEMKQCADIDLNTVTEMSESEKANVEENGVKEASPTDNNTPEEVTTENKVEKVTETKVEKETKVEETESKVEKESETILEKVKESSVEKVTESTEEKVVTNSVEKNEESKEEKVTEIPVGKVAETAVESTDSPMEKDTEKTEEKVAESSPMDTEAETPGESKVKEAQNVESESKESVDVKSNEVEPAKDKEEDKTADTVTEEVKPVSEAKETEKVADEAKTVEPVKDEAQSVEEIKAAEPTPQNNTDAEVKEPQLNGNATNGNTEKVMNGDASKDEELNARLSVENGNGKVNGSNGDSMDGEKGQGDCKTDAEVSDIKVKTVTTDEPRTDPIEQPTEA